MGEGYNMDYNLIVYIYIYTIGGLFKVLGFPSARFAIL